MAKGGNSKSSTGTALLGGAALGAGGTMAAGAGGTTIVSCPSDDKSFYCQLTRFVGIIRMVVYMIVLVATIFIVWNLWKAIRGGGKRR